MAAEADWNDRIISEFRANSGKVGGEFEGTPLLLLTTKGAKTGNPHTVPLLYLPYGDRLVVFASNSGSENHPDWYVNVLAHPMATVEVRHKMYVATVTIETGEFRDQLFADHSEQFPVFADEQRKTDRRIPAVSLRMAGKRPR